MQVTFIGGQWNGRTETMPVDVKDWRRTFQVMLPSGERQEYNLQQWAITGEAFYVLNMLTVKEADEKIAAYIRQRR